ncbi:hypothetical protein AVEN_58114-1 [Araneus ventricosus]|uniref:Uncharacterized protein n=1 Tax=Araneus ventricosus TaxID=182803 RepID=A0A4Y2KYZ0_ARAVE|nr:hypothetical protein AVEN_58114-1 [Araneus ventricosus]
MKRKRFHIPVKSLQSRTTPIRSITHAASTLLERMIPTVLCYLIPTSSTIYSPGGQSLAPPIATLGGVPIFTPVPVFTPVPLKLINGIPREFQDTGELFSTFHFAKTLWRRSGKVRYDRLAQKVYDTREDRYYRRSKKLAI